MSPTHRRATGTVRVRRILAAVVSVVVLGLAAVCAIALVRGTWLVTPILSGSMRPGLAVGGVAIGERVPVKSLAVRDVIVFQEPGQPSQRIVHRIISLSSKGSGPLLIRTQGDANSSKDPWTLTIEGQYAYRVRWSVPLIGYVAIAYQDHRGLALIGAGLVALAIAVSTLVGERRSSARRTGQSALASEEPPSLSP